MKKKILLTLAAISVVVIAGCTQASGERTTGNSSGANQSETTASSSTGKSIIVTPEDGTDAFVNSYLAENRKVTTVQQDLDSKVSIFNTTATGTGKFIFEFDKEDQSLTRYHSETSFQGSEGSLKTDFVYVAPNNYFAKNDAGEWEAVPEDMSRTLAGFGVVDYFKLVNSLADILVKEQDKYEIIDSHSSYEIVVTDKEFNFQTYLSGILELTLDELDPSDIERQITFKVNKDTLLFESVNIRLYYDQEDSKIDVDTTFTASQWNRANTSVFDEIPE